MADAKPPSKAATDEKEKSPTADKKKPSTAAASKTGKQDEKKDENIVAKTAHSIRDKVHEMTDEVKEKAHHLTHSDDAKKGKDGKKTDTKSKTSSKIPKTGKKDSDDDDKEEEDISKPPPPPSSSSNYI
jgi:hypothetical protein